MNKKKEPSYSDHDQLKGYLSEVSPVKTANNAKKTRYFTATLQTSKTETSRVVCFSPEKHQSFKTAETSKDTFLLRNAKQQPDRDGQISIKCFKETELHKSTVGLGFNKDYKQFMEEKTPEAVTLSIEDITNEYQCATVNVKFCGFTEVDTVVDTKWGDKLISKGTVADSTGTRQLTVWSSELKNKLIDNECYQIKNVVSKIYDDKLQFNTTSSTQISAIQPLQSVLEVETPVATTKSAQIESVMITKCSVCQKRITDVNDDPIIKCEHCYFKQKSSNLSSNVTVTANTGGNTDIQTEQITLKHDILVNFLSSEQKSALLKDVDALEDFLIIHGPYNITSTGNTVTEICRTSTENSGPVSDMKTTENNDSILTGNSSPVSYSMSDITSI